MLDVLERVVGEFATVLLDAVDGETQALKVFWLSDEILVSVVRKGLAEEVVVEHS